MKSFVLLAEYSTHCASTNTCAVSWFSKVEPKPWSRWLLRVSFFKFQMTMGFSYTSRLLCSTGTTKGKNQASQALARIGITINPEVAFPGQRMCEVVRPLLGLLHQECKALENFEALMALCNLAGFEAPRKRFELIVTRQKLTRLKR